MTTQIAPDLRRMADEARAIPQAKDKPKACRMLAAGLDGLAARVEQKGGCGE